MLFHEIFCSGYLEDDFEIVSKHCISSRISSVVARISRALKLDKTSILFPIDSIAQLVEQQSGNPKIRVRILL